MERRHTDADGRVWYWDQDIKPGYPPCKVYVVQTNEITMMSKLAFVASMATHPAPDPGACDEG